MYSSVGFHKIAFLIGFIVLILATIYQPLPKNFSQPWKYRFLSYGASRVDQIGYFFEKLGLGTRVELIRNLHYISIGLFQKRIPENRLKVFDREISKVPVRIYQPEESIDFEQRTTLIYFHGGGFLLGSIETYDQATYLLANLTRTTLISVEYRLAPEHRFPSALEDCLAVSREIFQKKFDFEINSKRIVISGDSAGGNLALSVGQHLIEEGHKPFLLCLLYPSLQFFDFTLPSYRTYLKQNILGVLNEENLLMMISLLIGKEFQPAKHILSNGHISNEDKKILSKFIDPNRFLSISHQLNETEEDENLIEHLKYLVSPMMSPLLVPDKLLSQLPPVLLFTTEFDILRDEGHIFAARLRSLNKKIYHHHFENGFHGAHVFLYGPLSFEIAHQMVHHTAEVLRHHFLSKDE